MTASAWDAATRQRINAKLHQALDAARARRLAASAPAPAPPTQTGSSAEALQAQLVAAFDHGDPRAIGGAKLDESHDGFLTR